MGICLQGNKKSIKKTIQTEEPKSTQSNERNEINNPKENNIERKDSKSKLQRRKSINVILKQNQNPTESKKLTNQRRQSLKYLNEFKNNDQMHNKNYLLNRLAKNLIKNTQNSEEYKEKNKAKFPEYIIDWKLVRHSNMETYTWKNNGYIKVTNDLIDEVLKMSPEEAKDCNFLYKKRIWLYFYINSQIQNSNNENPLILIHRNNILEESFNQFMTIKDINLLEELHIHFVDEIANDEGGVYREWYSCLFKEFFNIKNKLFIENNNNACFKGTYLIYPKYDNMKMEYYEFFGKLGAKALIDNVNISEILNRIVLNYLRGDKVVLDDMKYYDLDLYNSLKQINEIEDINSNDSFKEFKFVWNLKDENGNIKEVELIPGGSKISLSNENKNLFIEKIIYVETLMRYEEQIKRMRRIFKFIWWRN